MALWDSTASLGHRLRSRAWKRDSEACSPRARCRWCVASYRSGRCRRHAVDPSESRCAIMCHHHARWHHGPGCAVQSCGQPASPESGQSRKQYRPQPLRLETEAPLGAIEHDLCRRNLVIGARRRRLNIDNDRVRDVDEIVEPVAELHSLVGFGRPGRAGIDRRDHLRRLAVSSRIFVIKPGKKLSGGSGLPLWRRPVISSGALP